MPSKKKEKKLSSRGTKIKAGMLLTQFIKSIALEQTELIRDPKTGEDKMVSKAEALARLVFKKALGYTEQIAEEGNLVDIKHAPDRTMIALLWDRMEGRAPLMNPDKKDRRSIADRVSEQGKKRSNKIAESSIE